MIIRLKDQATSEQILGIQTAVVEAGFRCSNANVAPGRIFVHDYQLDVKPNSADFSRLPGIRDISACEMSVPENIAFQLQQ